MSDADDTRVPNTELESKEQTSLSSEQELIRNFLHRVAVDGSKDYNALQYLQGIAANSSVPGIIPMKVAVVIAADNEEHRLFDTMPNQRGIVFDIFCSIDGITDIEFHDRDGTSSVLSTMFAPNAGQGFSFSSHRGLWLARSESLYCSSTINQTNYSVMVSYAILEDVAP